MVRFKLNLFIILGLLTSIVMVSPAFAQNGGANLDPSNIDDARILQELAEFELNLATKNGLTVSPVRFQALKKMIGPLAYKVSQTRRWLAVKADMIFFKYPDAMAVDFMFRFAKYTVLYPILIHTGHAMWIPILEVGPEAMIATIPYVLTRMWLNKIRVRKQLGMEPTELKKILFDGLVDLNQLHLSTIDSEGESLIIPVLEEDDESQIVSQLDLERAIRGFDPHFVEELQKLDLDHSLYECALMQKLLSNRESRQWLTAKVNRELKQKSPEALLFYLQSENLLNRIRAESELLVPSFWRSLSPAKLKRWFDGTWKKMKMGRKVNEMQMSELMALAKYVKSYDREFPFSVRMTFKESRNELLKMMDDLRVIVGKPAVPPTACEKVMAIVQVVEQK